MITCICQDLHSPSTFIITTGISVFTPRVKTNNIIGFRYFFRSGPTLWNTLHNNENSSGSLINFRHLLNLFDLPCTPLVSIGLYRDVWIAAIASSRTSLATQTAAICVRFQGRRVRRVYVTMQVTFLTRKSALIYRRGLRQRVASLTIDCNGVFAIKAYSAPADSSTR